MVRGEGLGLQNYHQVFPANGVGHNHKITWHPIEMLDLRHFKVCDFLWTAFSLCKRKIKKPSHPKIELFPKIGRDWHAGGWLAVTMVNMIEGGSLEY